MKRFTPDEATQLIGKEVRWVDIENPEWDWYETTVESVDLALSEIHFVDDPTPRDLLWIKMELVE
jgi:hypothetical protein